MDVTWYGHSCFRLRFKGATVITDPYNGEIGLKLPRQKADIVTVSHDHTDHNHTRGVSGEFRTFGGPGEYERAGIFVFGIPTYHDRRNGRDRGRNTVFLIEGEGVSVCHLGDLGHVLTQAQIEQLNSVDVLLIPVGGNPTLNASEAAEVVGLLSPRFVIPMHYQLPGLKVKLDPVTKFLQAMGLANVVDPARSSARTEAAATAPLGRGSAGASTGATAPLGRGSAGAGTGATAPREGLRVLAAAEPQETQVVLLELKQ